MAAADASSIPGLGAGISQRLAQWRASQYRDLRYALDVSIDPAAGTLAGGVEISFSFNGAPVPLVLDWRGGRERLQAVAANGKPLARLDLHDDHLVIPATRLRRGMNRVRIAFTSPVSDAGGPLTRYRDPADGTQYWYMLFVPADASRVLPCLDQPDLKARFTLSLRTPTDWRVVANGREAPALATGESVEHRFAETAPISTYLFAFAAGPFATIEETTPSTSPGPVRLLVRRAKLEQARREADAVLTLNRRALDWYADYFAHRFPFDKYDLVLIPELAYGGMEHAGATFLREESVLFPFQPATSDRFRRAQLVLHETAHQWFGDLVTMRWFDDLWLKEGFANFMAAKASAALLTDELASIDPWIAFNSVKTAAYRTDVTAGTTPIWQALRNLDAAKSAYGNIVYSKAPAVLRQAEFFVGEATFRSGVQAFLTRHAYGAARWEDLVRALADQSGRPLDPWAKAWVKQRGMPRVTAERTLDAQGRLHGVTLRQSDVLREGGRWPMRLRVLHLPSGAAAKARHEEVLLEKPRARVTFPGVENDGLVFANDGDFGYGQFLLDEASLAFALESVGAIDDALLRALVLESLWESVREAELDPERYAALAMKQLPAEKDDLTAALLLARLRTVHLRYLTTARRERAQATIERFLWGEATAGRTTSRRIAAWRAFTDVARTAEAREHLKALLDGRERIEGVTLQSRDRFRVIETLIAAGDPEGESRLASQSAADPSGEGHRYAFGAAAARPDAAAKRVLFERFLKDPTLQESWIEEALGAFNETDQAALTREFLTPALAALPALKRERRIFFINNWLAAFIGGQEDAQALATVKRVARNAKLDADLRRKVLEAMDALERTVRIRTAFP